MFILINIIILPMAFKILLGYPRTMPEHCCDESSGPTLSSARWWTRWLQSWSSGLGTLELCKHILCTRLSKLWSQKWSTLHVYSLVHEYLFVPRIMRTCCRGLLLYMLYISNDACMCEWDGVVKSEKGTWALPKFGCWSYLDRFINGFQHYAHNQDPSMLVDLGKQLCNISPWLRSYTFKPEGLDIKKPWVKHGAMSPISPVSDPQLQSKWTFQLDLLSCAKCAHQAWYWKILLFVIDPYQYDYFG